MTDMMHDRTDYRLFEQAKSFFEKPMTTFLEEHDRKVSLLTADALRSPVYNGRIKQLNSIEELNSAPLTSWDTISSCIDARGIDNVLLKKPVIFWETSGYTGNSKRFYYDDTDLEWITRSIISSSYVLGMRPWNSGWSFGGGYPLLSGNIIEMSLDRACCKEFLSTPVNNDGDFIKALKKVSREKALDVMAGPPLLYMMIARMASEPEYFERLAAEKISKMTGLPQSIARIPAKLYLAGIGRSNLRSIVENVKICVSYSEPMDNYAGILKQRYPSAKFRDYLGSTEVPLYGVQLSSDECLSLILQNVIPELAKPEDVIRARADPGYTVNAVPWHRWEKGMRGELIVTRPGGCLPLVRYPTGDLVEVVDPAHAISVDMDGGRVGICLPAIKVLGRSVDALDFEVPDEMGIFLVGKIYSRQLNEALCKDNNVRWWELYHVKGDPGRYVILVIPEGNAEDACRLKSDILKSITGRCDELAKALNAAAALDSLEILITGPEAYDFVKGEIDRRIKEKRSLGQLKPRHIYHMNSEGELGQTLKEKYGLKL